MNPDPNDEPVVILGGPTPGEFASRAQNTYERIRDRIRELVEAGGDGPYPLREAARDLGVLPLDSESEERWCGVRPNGDLLSFALRAPYDELLIEDQWRRTAELSLASERYPELAFLVHSAPLSCRPCPRCGGEGRIRLRGDWAVCLCAGLGWLPPAEDPVVPPLTGRPGARGRRPAR